MFKYLAIIALACAYTSAEYLYGENPYNYGSEYASAYDNYKPKDYKFEYGVSDPHTGDHKSQWEVKENGVVRGAYSLLEADGTTRVVEYYADDTGFHADVKKIGTPIEHQHPVIAPVVHHAAAAAVGSTYGYGDIAQFTGYGNGAGLVNYAHAPAVAAPVVAHIPQEHHHFVAAAPQPFSLPQEHHHYAAVPEQHYAHQQLILPQKSIVEQVVLPQKALVLPHQEHVVPQQQLFAAPQKVIVSEPQQVYYPEVHQQKVVLPQNHLELPYNHAQSFAKVVLQNTPAVPVHYSKEVVQQYDVPYYPKQVVQQYDAPQYQLPQAVKYIPEQIKYEVPEAKYVHQVPIAVQQVPHHKNVVVYENDKIYEVPQHYQQQQYVNYQQEQPAYYEKSLPYGYGEAQQQYHQAY